MTQKRQALDGAERRRIYLFRHGAVDYVGADGKVVDDTDAVSLNERGRSEADAMRELFAEVRVDRAVCSGLKRTRETGERVLAGRSLQMDIESGLVEIRPDTNRQADYDLHRDVAFSHWYAAEPQARFLGGERYADFYERISQTMARLVVEDSWQNLAVFAHGGTNAAVLGWVTNLGLGAFGVVDQATCCLNVVDIDFDAEQGKIVRKVVRGMNITTGDPAKANRDCGDMEALARYLAKFA